MSSANTRIFSRQVALSMVGVALACGTAQAPSPAPAPPVEGGAAERVDEAGFSRQRAWNHLVALTEHGPRVSGTDGARRAADYIRSELRRMEIEILEEPEALPGRYVLPEGAAVPDNIEAEIPGGSEDLIVLVAPYDSRPVESFDFVGANDGASGAALLLELAKVLSRQEPAYTIRLVFLDAEAPRAEAEGPAPRPRLDGSRLQAARFSEAGLVPRIRLLVGFNRICDADLTITRDLGSHRLHREDFWQAAARLGHDDAFKKGQPFETVTASHLPFFAVGARRVVFISDSIFGGDEPPGLYAGTEDDDTEHCSAKSLQVVGDVTLEALRTISRRLAKIDRFSTSPLAKLGNEQPEAGNPASDEVKDSVAPGARDEAGEAPVPVEAPTDEAGEAPVPVEAQTDEAPPAEASAP